MIDVDQPDPSVMPLRDPAGAARQQLRDRWRARRGSPAVLAAGRLLSEYGEAGRTVLRCCEAGRPEAHEADRLLEVAGLLPIGGAS